MSHEKLCRRFLSLSLSRIFHSYIREIKEIHSFSVNSCSLSDARCLLIVLRVHVHVVLCSARLLFDVLHFVRLPGTFPSPSCVRLTDRWPRTIDRYKFVCNQLANRMEKGRDLSSCAGSTRASCGVSIRYIRQMNALCARGRVEYRSRKYRDRSRASPLTSSLHAFIKPTPLPRHFVPSSLLCHLFYRCEALLCNQYGDVTWRTFARSKVVTSDKLILR